MTYLEKVLRDDPALISEEYGVARYKDVNANVISICQRHAMHQALSSTLKEYFNYEPIKGLVIGGPIHEFPADESTRLNVVRENSDIWPYDGSRIPAADNYFHVVNTCHSMEHLADPKTTVNEVLRVLKIGGLFVNVVPDRMFHRHDMSNHKVGDRCYHEWTPEECFDLLFKNYIRHGAFRLLQFNTRQNKLDFDIILRKLK